MNKLTPTAIAVFAALGGLCLAQGTLPTGSLPTGPQPDAKNNKENPDKPKTNTVDIPLWLRELSNLPVKDRNAYTQAFAQAKTAYAAARLAECEAYLNSCEFIYQGNPNVWSLRASLYIAQRRFDEAEPLMEKVLQEQPDDSITTFNYSLLYLGRGEYQRCLERTTALYDEVRYTEGMQLLHSLKFRILLCHLMLGQEKEARDLVQDLTPLDDSPLYYYSQAAFCIYRGDASQAMKDIASADRIYAREKYLLSYKQNLSFSKLQDKYLKKGDGKENK